MGTQHADEVSTNAAMKEKLGGSYSVFARDTMRGMHDAIVAKSLDFDPDERKETVIPAEGAKSVCGRGE